MRLTSEERETLKALGVDRDTLPALERASLLSVSPLIGSYTRSEAITLLRRAADLMDHVSRSMYRVGETGDTLNATEEVATVAHELFEASRRMYPDLKGGVIVLASLVAYRLVEKLTEEHGR